MEGIELLGDELKGTESIYLGIRPYGFHAGNATVFVVYPLLLCKELIKRGKIPKFIFHIFINDWEQDSLDGPNPKLYPFNVVPKKTTFQYMEDPFGCCSSVVDHWEAIIRDNVMKIKEEFPHVVIKCVRNSSMRDNSKLKYYLLKTINEPSLVLNAIKKYTSKKTLNNPMTYAMAICPNCHSAKGKTNVLSDNNSIQHVCDVCGGVSKGVYSNFDYWFYHKILALPRLDFFNIDLCITGLDHYDEGDFLIRKKLIKDFGNKIKVPRTLYAPTILGADGLQMGKSRNNDVFVEIDELVDIISNSEGDKIIISTKKSDVSINKLVLGNVNGK